MKTLTVCVTLVYAQNSDTACADQPNGKLVAVAGDTSKFYHCDNCVGVLKSCAAGLIFSERVQGCIWPDAGCGGAGSGGCGSGSTPAPGTTQKPPVVSPSPGSTECPDLCPDGIYRPNPDDDGSYIVCDNGVDTVMKCPCGLVWNNDLQTCDWKDGGCGGGVPGCTGCSGGSGSGSCKGKA